METIGDRPKYHKIRVVSGRDPNTNVPRFETRRVQIVDATHPPEEPPMEGSPTIVEAESQRIKRVADKFEQSGRPMGGSEPSND